MEEARTVVEAQEAVSGEFGEVCSLPLPSFTPQPQLGDGIGANSENVLDLSTATHTPTPPCQDCRSKHKKCYCKNSPGLTATKILSKCQPCKSKHRRCLHNEQGGLDPARCLKYLDDKGWLPDHSRTKTEHSAIVEAANNAAKSNNPSSPHIVLKAKPNGTVTASDEIEVKDESALKITSLLDQYVQYDDIEPLSTGSPTFVDMDAWTRHSTDEAHPNGTRLQKSPAQRPPNASPEANTTGEHSLTAAISPPNHQNSSSDPKAQAGISSEDIESNKFNQISSPESEQSIPYRAAERDDQFHIQKQAEQASASDTIHVRADSDRALYASNQKRAQKVVWWEGAKDLDPLPSHLQRQLDFACDHYNTDIPGCAKTAWQGAKSVFNAGALCDKKAWFVDPDTGAELATARYRYGKIHQIIVVKQEQAGTFNGGKAAILVHLNSGQQQRYESGREILTQIWRVWNPYRMTEDTVVQRRIEKTITKKHVRTSPKSSSGSMAQSSVPQRDSHHRSFNQKLSDLHPKLQGDDAFKALKRPAQAEVVPEDSAGTKRFRQSSDAQGTLYQPSLYKGETDGADAWSITWSSLAGQLVARRRGDDTVMKLHCPECHKVNFMTASGLASHCRQVHGLKFQSDAVVDICGVPSRKLGNRSHTPMSSHRPSSRRMSSLNNNGGQHVSATLTPSSASVVPDTGPVFVFRKDEADANLRVRSLKACSSAERLFVNAVVAGVAKKDTLMLTVRVGDDEPINIVRGDAEDFTTIIRAIERFPPGDPVEIVVTVEDMDL